MLVLQITSQSFQETLKTVIETVKDAWQTKSEVAESAGQTVEEAFSEEFSKEFMDKVFETGYGKLVIDKEGFINTDVLVLGGGIAGCMAALSAKDLGADVVLVDHNQLALLHFTDQFVEFLLVKLGREQ